MSIHVDPKVTVYSDCTSCCPRFLRVWMCCCCKINPEQVEAIDDVARVTIERKHSHGSHSSHKHSSHTKKTSKK